MGVAVERPGVWPERLRPSGGCAKWMSRAAGRDVRAPAKQMPGRRFATQAVALDCPCEITLSTIWVSWPLPTAPIWVASTLPPLNTIRVGMPRMP